MGAMHRSGLIVREDRDRVGSLTLALEALLRWAGANVRYRSLDAALGLSLRTTAVRRRSCLGWWSTFGSDVYLAETARMFGIRIRALHPPEAAAGLSVHGPFEQHFEASYRPLVVRALEHGQPVIAWRGWPDARESLWGVITEVTDAGLGLAGTVMWSHGAIVPLLTPPVQVYVVEEVRPRVPDDDALIRAATLRFRDVLHNRMGDDPGVVTGVEALDVWLERLKGDAVCPTCAGRGDRGGRCHVQHARFLTSHRASGVRFFRHYRDGVDRGLKTMIDALLVECQGWIDALGTSRDPAAVEVLVKSPEGRDALAAGIRAARTFETAMTEAIERLGDALGSGA